MKKFVSMSFVYLFAALAGGVFYREFTKAFAFTGVTTLSFVHVHLFMLGVAFPMILALFCMKFDLTADRRFKAFFALYNGGLIVMTATFIWRGILQVWGAPVASGLNGAISGIAGLGHICLAVGLVLAFLILRKQMKEQASAEDFRC